MRKILIYTFLLLAYPVGVVAQSEQDVLIPGLHQIYLDKPAKKVDFIKYEKTGKQINGGLSSDGKKVILRDYEKKGRVAARIHYADGQIETISKSSCFIDPLIQL